MKNVAYCYESDLTEEFLKYSLITTSFCYHFTLTKNKNRNIACNLITRRDQLPGWTCAFVCIMFFSINVDIWRAGKEDVISCLSFGVKIWGKTHFFLPLFVLDNAKKLNHVENRFSIDQIESIWKLSKRQQILKYLLSFWFCQSLSTIIGNAYIIASIFEPLKM